MTQRPWTLARVAAARERWLEPDHLRVCPECGVETDAPLDEECDCGHKPLGEEY